MTARDDGNFETWMLFCSGGATRIDVDLHEPAERGHAMKVAHVVKECDAAMRDAAERGCRAALAWIERRRGTAPACVVSFDLPDVPAGRDVGDASGGLAFAVAAARGMHTGVPPGAIAAIGELESGLRGGPVRGVESIEAKIGGALARLPEGGRLVYPTRNDPEIPARFREQLNEQSIETKTVASVDEALDWLFPAIEVVPPTVADAACPPGSFSRSPEAGIGESGAEPSLSARWFRAETRTLARWLIAIGGAGAAAIAIWYGSGGPRAPALPVEQTAATAEAAEPSPPPAGRRDEDTGTEPAGTPLSTPDAGAREAAPAGSSFKEISNDRGFD